MFLKNLCYVTNVISTGTWQQDQDTVLVPGSNTVAGVFNLRPATTYHLRIVAENEIGESDPSDTVTIITAEEGENDANNPLIMLDKYL